jgi:hypothetical protein
MLSTTCWLVRLAKPQNLDQDEKDKAITPLGGVEAVERPRWVSEDASSTSRAHVQFQNHCRER